MIKGATDADGATGADSSDRQPRRVVSAESSAQVRDLMQARGRQPERSAATSSWTNYQSGGKTGTAQRADTKCRCYKGYVTSFVGFAPLDDPQILTYVVVSQSAARATPAPTTAAPVYQDIMNMALPRYSVAAGRQAARAAAHEW